MTDMPLRQRGFSLVELMVTMVVAVILLAVAVPSFRDLIRRNQVGSASNTVLASLDYARTEAINRSQLVSICPSADGASCSAGSKAFEPGWLIYTYPSGAASVNQAYTAAAILLRVSTTRTGVSIQSRGTEVITFGQQGQLKSKSSALPTLAFVTCYRDGSSGTGTSTSAVPGAELDVNGSGSVPGKASAVGSACTPS